MSISVLRLSAIRSKNRSPRLNASTWMAEQRGEYAFQLAVVLQEQTGQP
jgi:hypothetical protein